MQGARIGGLQDSILEKAQFPDQLPSPFYTDSIHYI